MLRLERREVVRYLKKMHCAPPCLPYVVTLLVSAIDFALAFVLLPRIVCSAGEIAMEPAADRLLSPEPVHVS